MNYCLSTPSFFLLFLSLLLSNDAQARVFPGLSLNNDLIILNLGGRMSSLPPPSSTISSPLMEITRSSSSSIFEISFDGFRWITSSVPASKAASANEQQQAEQIISNHNHETSNPWDKLITIPSTPSNLASPPRGSWPSPIISKVHKSTPPARASSDPIIHKSVNPPPIMPSPTSLYATPNPEPADPPKTKVHSPPIMPSPTSLYATPNPEPADPPITKVHSPPIMPSPTSLYATPNPKPAIPPKTKAHPPPIMPSPISLYATPNPKRADPPKTKVHPPPIMPSSTSLHAPHPAIPPKAKVHPPPIMPSPTILHATPNPMPAIPPNQKVHPPPIRPSSKSNDQMVDWIRTPSNNDSVISMIKHPQNDYIQAS